MSNDMQELGQGKEDVSNAIRGHKANLSNPNTSDESKKHSEQEIARLGGDASHYGGGEDQPKSKSAANNLEGSRVA